MIRAASAGEDAELRFWPSLANAALRNSTRFRSVISVIMASETIRSPNAIGHHLISTSMISPFFRRCRHIPA